MPVASISADDVRQGMPHRVGVGVRLGTVHGVGELYAVEEEALGLKAAPRRRAYFSLGRGAARDALFDLGEVPVAIGRGPGGEPLWPNGVVGAITHSGDKALAIAGRRSEYAGLGLDLEQLSPGLSVRAARLVCTPSEHEWLSEGPDVWRTMLFSAKEAVFKAMYPIEGVWLGFGDAELRWKARESVFEARLLKSAGAGYPVGFRLRVRCVVGEGEVLSTTYVLADGAVYREGKSC